MNIECRKESEQLLFLDSNARFLPFEVLFDTLRSATLNPYISPVSSTNFWAQFAVERIKSLILAKQSYQLLQFFKNLLLTVVLAGYQFNVVTTLLEIECATLDHWHLRHGLNQKMKLGVGDQVYIHIFHIQVLNYKKET